MADGEREDGNVELARIEAKTRRYEARLNSRTARAVARSNKWPFVTIPAAVIGAAAVLAGERTDLGISLFATITAGATVTLAAPAAGFKFYFDWRQKRYLRARCAVLEMENEELKLQCARLEGRLEQFGVGSAEPTGGG